MPDTYVAKPRTALGKAATKLRREGTLPANIYGRALESKAVQLASKDVTTILKTHGTNTLIELQVEGEPQARPVVIREVQRHPVNQQLQHVDFYQVDLARPIQAQVPVTLLGESSAVQTYKGVLLVGLDNVLVEALPHQMPTHVEVSIESITELEGSISVADIVPPAGVTVLTNPTIMLARVGRGRGSAAVAAPVAEGEQKK